MSYRKLVYFFLGAMCLFLGANYTVWKLWTEDLLTATTYHGGDLARMGYVYGSKDFRKNHVDLPKRHRIIKEYDGQHVDMLTIGDSFSNGGAGGRNSYYQDYIASINNLEVANLPRIEGQNLLTTVSALSNGGVLERFKARHVLIGVDEKLCFELASPIELDLALNPGQLARLKPVNYYATRPALTLINNGNLKFLLYRLLYRFSDHGPSGVYTRRLTKEFFSVPDSSQLLFLRYKRLPDAETVRLLNDNLNAVADRLERKGVKLVFMPCVDKYNLYSDYIVDNPYQRSTFFEELRKQPKRYRFIDTKAILAEELRKGEKDVYYADDTHWSWKASKKIFETVRFE